MRQKLDEEHSTVGPGHNGLCWAGCSLAGTLRRKAQRRPPSFHSNARSCAVLRGLCKTHRKGFGLPTLGGSDRSCSLSHAEGLLHRRLCVFQAQQIDVSPGPGPWGAASGLRAATVPQDWSPYSVGHFVWEPDWHGGRLTGLSLNLPGTTAALITKGARCSALLALHSACGVWVDESKWLYQVHNLW